MQQQTETQHEGQINSVKSAGCKYTRQMAALVHAVEKCLMYLQMPDIPICNFGLKYPIYEGFLFNLIKYGTSRGQKLYHAAT